MSKFVVMDGEDRILGKFSTCEAVEVTRLEYGRMIAGNSSELFKKNMERTLVVDDPKKKKTQRIASSAFSAKRQEKIR